MPVPEGATEYETPPASIPSAVNRAELDVSALSYEEQTGPKAADIWTYHLSEYYNPIGIAVRAVARGGTFRFIMYRTAPLEV